MLVTIALIFEHMSFMKNQVALLICSTEINDSFCCITDIFSCALKKFKS